MYLIPKSRLFFGRPRSLNQVILDSDVATGLGVGSLLILFADQVWWQVDVYVVGKGYDTALLILLAFFSF